MSVDHDLRRLAEQQYGLVSCTQWRELGGTWEGLRSRLRGPDWEWASSRVVRLVGVRASPEQALMAAVLDGGPGTVASHSAAAALWGIPGFRFGAVEVSRQRDGSRRPVPAVGNHWPRYLPKSHVTELAGIPVTSLARTVFDLAGCERPQRIERALDTLVSRSPALLVSLHRLLEELAQHGRGGIRVMRALLDVRPVGSVPPASGLEARVQRILADAGEPPLERQVDVGGHEWIGRIDFADRTVGLLVEVDSNLHHSSRIDRERDRRRDEALYTAGWRLVVRLTEEQVWHRPREVVAAVREARRRLRAA